MNESSMCLYKPDPVDVNHFAKCSHGIVGGCDVTKEWIDCYIQTRPRQYKVINTKFL